MLTEPASESPGHTCLKSGVAKQRGTADCSCILPRMVWLLTSCCWNKVREPLRMICQPGRLVRNTIMSWRMTSVKPPTLWTAERAFYAGLLLFFVMLFREEALFFFVHNNGWSKKSSEIEEYSKPGEDWHRYIIMSFVMGPSPLESAPKDFVWFLHNAMCHTGSATRALVKDIFLARNLVPPLCFFCFGRGGHDEDWCPRTILWKPAV